MGERCRWFFCVTQRSLTWNNGKFDIKTDEFDDVFRDEVEKAGFKVAGDKNNLFEQQSNTSEYGVAGAIKSINGYFCFPYLGMGNTSDVRGHASMTIEWQIYSYLERKVVGRVDTDGSFDLKKSAPGGVQTIVEAAFAQNVKELVESPEFKDAANAKSLEEGATAKAASQQPIDFTPSLVSTMRVADDVGDVVTIFAGATQGSGFLLGKEGYVLTNAHVVGDAKLVKVHWSDGVEVVGDVVRSDHGRDVALVKVDARGRQPLPISTRVMQPGDPVYAIGAPLDLKFQSTVTKGVYSAFRTIGGYTYIQSDVTINPGNSGGPLLNDDGAVIGLTVAAIRTGSSPTGLNFFIPIRDALDFLALSSTSGPKPTLARRAGCDLTLKTTGGREQARLLNGRFSHGPTFPERDGRIPAGMEP